MSKYCQPSAVTLLSVFATSIGHTASHTYFTGPEPSVPKAEAGYSYFGVEDLQTSIEKFNSNVAPETSKVSLEENPR